MSAGVAQSVARRSCTRYNAIVAIGEKAAGREFDSHLRLHIPEEWSLGWQKWCKETCDNLGQCRWIRENCPYTDFHLECFTVGTKQSEGK